MKRNKVIVIGAGFAGLQFLQSIEKDRFDILLIDRLNHHQFQPLFYQVATSQLEPSSISFPLRHIFQDRKDIRIRMTSVRKILHEEHLIRTDIGDFPYDFLIIATGAQTNFYGNKEIATHALKLKTTHEAITIRNTVLTNFERLLSTTDEEEKKRMLNIIIVGAGPTGVELSGAFAEIKKYVLPKDFQRIDFSRLRVILIEGGAEPLSAMSAESRKASAVYIKELGVELMLNTTVSSYDGKKVVLSDGKEIPSSLVIWAAGVTGNWLDGIAEDMRSKGNRIAVDRLNQVQGMHGVYAVGDIAYMETPLYPKGLPQLANVAINQAQNLAKNLKKDADINDWKAYEYKDLGSMATIGRNKAVVDLPFVKFKGYFAWFVWMFLHLMLILRVKNKLIIFINWTSNYFTRNSSLRLILSEKEDEF
jgi:NADH dehydrogenase